MTWDGKPLDDQQKALINLRPNRFMHEPGDAYANFALDTTVVMTQAGIRFTRIAHYYGKDQHYFNMTWALARQFQVAIYDPITGEMRLNSDRYPEQMIENPLPPEPITEKEEQAYPALLPALRPEDMAGKASGEIFYNQYEGSQILIFNKFGKESFLLMSYLRAKEQEEHDFKKAINSLSPIQKDGYTYEWSIHSPYGIKREEYLLP